MASSAPQFCRRQTGRFVPLGPRIFFRQHSTPPSFFLANSFFLSYFHFLPLFFLYRFFFLFVRDCPFLLGVPVLFFFDRSVAIGGGPAFFYVFFFLLVRGFPFLALQRLSLTFPFQLYSYFFSRVTVTTCAFCLSSKSSFAAPLVPFFILPGFALSPGAFFCEHFTLFPLDSPPFYAMLDDDGH